MFRRPRVEIQCRTKRFGSDYGGWEVAVDGLDAHSIVYSFGIGEDATFDLELIRRFGLTVHGFDPTPRSLDWVERQQLPAEFIMHDYGLADRDGPVSFFPPAKPEHVSHSVLSPRSTRAPAITVSMHRLGSILSELGHDHLDLLKLDIEGAEYAVIEDLERSAIRPSQILVEFHHRFSGVGFGKTRTAVATLRRLGYRLFTVASRGEEYGFVHG